ncbi:hypothetical protein DFH08DRAFT_768630 [Mycena albidolilacea]|uniref:F-box domain-containing protein n=1 Tax=Mycena albidolilacea TaxID=1033008 RepID=A0AAD7F0I3_9AGAR|nr:hypothetical protein DFH08DRAFT_768630 [Mycena albidolilacea]
MRQLEEVQRDIYPRMLPEEAQHQLVFARQSYMLRYFRIFRVNDLPTEIISNILRFVIWDSMKRPVDARLRVTWTCRAWREIALNDSTLWNAIWFRGSGPRTDRAWAWFDRARQAPLDVRIDGDTQDEGADDASELSSVLDLSAEPSMSAADMRPMLLRLFTKLATIRMLIIVVDDWKSALSVLELLGTLGPPCGVPMLQRFELHRGGLRNEDRKTLVWPNLISQPFIGGIVPPSLAYLSLNGVPIDWGRSVVQNLTTFDIRRLPVSHSPTSARFREILASCPRLQKLSMDGAGPIFEDQNTDSEPIIPVDLPHLRTLVVADFSVEYAMFLFSQFSAPDVNDLTLMNLCGDDYLSLFLQLTSAFTKVRLLTCYSIQFDVSPPGLTSMTRWLDSMPLLTYLRVANVANQFFGIFFRPTDIKTPVCPHLVVVDCQSIEPSILVQWTKDRHNYGTPLRKIYVSEELAKGLASEKGQIEALRSLCVLACLPRGATTPEEEALTL